MIDKVLDFFDWYGLHDLALLAMSFDFERQTIVLTVEDIDSEDNEVVLRLVFHKPFLYTLDYPHEDENYTFNLGCFYSAVVKQKDRGYQINFLIDMRHKEKKIDAVVCEMIIGFHDFEYEGGLSREAMEKKWG